MDVSELRKRARSARGQSAKEKLALIESILLARTGAADDKCSQRITVAWQEIGKVAVSAADRGKRDTILLRLSSQLYDLRQAVLEELQASATRTPDPYPQLRLEGPYAFRDVDRWLREELKFADPEHTSPLLWLDHLARWVQRQGAKTGLARLLASGAPISGDLKALFQECQKRKLSPKFAMYHQFEDTGVALHVSW